MWSDLLSQYFRWLFESGRVDKKFDFLHCLENLIDADTEEMKPMRSTDASDKT